MYTGTGTSQYNLLLLHVVSQHGRSIAQSITISRRPLPHNAYCRVPSYWHRVSSTVSHRPPPQQLLDCLENSRERIHCKWPVVESVGNPKFYGSIAIRPAYTFSCDPSPPQIYRNIGECEDTVS
jgi:hypothetical protein